MRTFGISLSASALLVIGVEAMVFAVLRDDIWLAVLSVALISLVPPLIVKGLAKDAARAVASCRCDSR